MNFGIPNKPLKWEYLYLIQFEIEIAMSALSALNANQEKSLRDTKKSFDDFVTNNKEAVESLPKEYQDSYYSHLHYEDDMMINDLQRLQRYSIVVLIFCFYESKLQLLCKEIESLFPDLGKLKQINEAQDLKRFWRYFSEILKINSEALYPLYEKIRQQKYLRNILITTESFQKRILG